MNQDNIILNLPFDESKGSDIAYDYSGSRTDGVVSGANFVPGIEGNAIEFKGSDMCRLITYAIDMDADFSILFWAKNKKVDNETSQQMSWLLDFDDTSKIEAQMTVAPEKWYSVALTKHGNDYNFYLNSQLIQTDTNTSELKNIALNQDFYTGEYGFGFLDNLKIYNISLTQDEINAELAIGKSKQKYFINGIDFVDFGVYVSDSDGIINRPKLKTLQSFSWDDYYGETVDLEHKFYEPREITLSCFIKAESKTDFIDKIWAFEQVLSKSGTQRLMIEVLPTKPLIYEVYCKDEISVSKKWNDRLMTGTFKLKLIEPEPAKRLLKHIYSNDDQKASAIALTSKKLLNIYWGDGQVDFDVFGTNKIIIHEYKKKGEYYPLITGDIDKITYFETNDIIVWSKF